MPIRFKNIAHILLAVFLLLSSMGISVNKMVCLSKGKATYYLLQKKSCCPTDFSDKSPDTLKAHCCDFVSSYVQVDLLSVENPLKIKVEPRILLPTYLYRVIKTLFERPLFLTSTDIPPLLHGISLLKTIQSFLI